MIKILRYFLFLTVLSFVSETTYAQVQNYKELHKVKKKETIFGIARDYGLTLQQLIDANPKLNTPGYQLQKDDVLKIPLSTNSSVKSASALGRTIRLGVMLPLHNINGDGHRMVEYYRGVLMACDSMKKEGISVDVRAWNLAENGNVTELLKDKDAQNRDIIIGPLYSKFMEPLSNFVKKHNIMLVVPFSIRAPQLSTNKNIFQIYQNPESMTDVTARRCSEWFRDYHPIIVDCHDSTSTKGAFTTSLRHQLEQHDVLYNVTSLSTAEDNFAKAFVANMPNLVILNTARSPELLRTFTRLKNLLARRPNLEIALFGYTEWLMYMNQQKDNFHRFNVYIPSYFYTNMQSPLAIRLERRYETNFGQIMQQALPRFALTGFDHAVFFLRGVHKYGKTFDGMSGRFGYQPVQTPLWFERIAGGGYQNRAYMFVHYKPDGTIEAINY